MCSPSGLFPRQLFASLEVWGALLILTLGAGWTAGPATADAANDGAGPARIDWPEFRGPWGNGHAVAPGDTQQRGLPVHWSETENVAWKTPIPHKGWSTPVVVDGQIWLTTATTDGHDFFAICLDAETGQVRFNIKVFHTDDPEPLGNNVNGYASPSPVAELGRLYVHFGSYGTACLDTATGEVLWERRDLPCRHFRGPGSSPVLFEDLLVLSFDGVDVQYMTALDKISGDTVWKTDRSTVWHDLDAEGQPLREGDFRKAYSTPFVYEAGGNAQMITLGSSSAFAYDPRTGREIWSALLPGFTPAARPVFGKGHVFIATGRRPPELWAIRVDGKGDVTNTHVSWKVGARVAPQEPSPLLVNDLIYVVSNEGYATCLEAETGEVIWSERIGGSYMASPIYVDGRLYFFSVQGKATVLQVGRTYKILATNRLESGFMASPAVSGRALFLRSKTHLYRIESEATEAK